MRYADGYVLAVPTVNKEAYTRMANEAAAVFREHGALQIVETWGDDVPEGEVTSFSMAVKRKDDESIVFSWVTWPSKEARDEGLQKVMEDPRLQGQEYNDVFDGKRMIYGGFTPIVICGE